MGSVLTEWVLYTGGVCSVLTGSGCWDGWTENPDTGECYLLVKELVVVGDAHTYCASLAQNDNTPEIISLSTSQEHVFVYGKTTPAAAPCYLRSHIRGSWLWVKGQVVDGDRLWLGMKNMADNYWLDGTPVGYFNFAPGEPNSYQDGNYCIMMSMASGLWEDAICLVASAFICEMKGTNYVGPIVPIPPPGTIIIRIFMKSREKGGGWSVVWLGTLCLAAMKVTLTTVFLVIASVVAVRARWIDFLDGVEADIPQADEPQQEQSDGSRDIGRMIETVDNIFKNMTEEQDRYSSLTQDAAENTALITELLTISSVSLRLMYEPEEGHDFNWKEDDILLSVHLQWHPELGNSGEVVINDKHSRNWGSVPTVVRGNKWPNLTVGEKFSLSVIKNKKCFKIVLLLGEERFLMIPFPLSAYVFCPQARRQSKMEQQPRKLRVVVNEFHPGAGDLDLYSIMWYPNYLPPSEATTTFRWQCWV
ncbi:Low affinity immunoglobulin epsilon Fc receptor-like [Homarus americanus]|uniref:Low affinity immunoglobulin epsilon Fc receptor-like n=1 Tax=Homarus americanus TaxID=6706 RepID=A0A8J5K507_HOMAM|nr:Low affinity immunoglobulin epsilon Fc receptor-like [Homarus americanus]